MALFAAERGKLGYGRTGELLTATGLMLVDALSRAMTAADAIGARALLVHAIDEDALVWAKIVHWGAWFEAL